MNDCIRTIMNRKSVRSFDDRPVDEATRALVLDAALRAPSAGNMLLYSIIEVEEQALKDRLAQSCDNQPFIARSPWVILFAADYARWMDYFAASGAPELAASRGEKFCLPREGDLFLALDDALVAAQTAVLAAESLGLGSCYIGDIMENFELHRELFELPRYVFPAALLCIGYPTEQQRSRPMTHRPSRDDVVSKNRYTRKTPAELVSLMDPPPGKSCLYIDGAPNFGTHMYLRKFAAPFSEEMRRSVKKALEDWA